ncbi:MAG TPA: electron transfer flavoprotein subunit beta/FixA family protein [Candidatus Nanopelagicales bacterium]|nr:electron transfer flavoprotein subunit beta/FixA family protein [Candidatus Nanopelagicales bacterium]
MHIAVCAKRIPLSGGRWVLTPDSTEIDTSGPSMGFTLSPHEECAAEAAVQLVEQYGGSSTVLTVGVPDSETELRSLLAVGIDRGVLVETDGREWDPQATAAVLTEQIQKGTPEGDAYELVICGTEAGDTADYQVPVRIAHALGWPVVTNVKGLSITDGVVRCERAVGSAREIYEVPLPAVISVKDGVNIPRYPSVPGRIKARKKPVDVVAGERPEPRLEKTRLDLVEEETRSAEVLGTGPDAVPALVEIFKKIGVI